MLFASDLAAMRRLQCGESGAENTIAAVAAIPHAQSRKLPCVWPNKSSTLQKALFTRKLDMILSKAANCVGAMRGRRDRG